MWLHVGRHVTDERRRQDGWALQREAAGSPAILHPALRITPHDAGSAVLATLLAGFASSTLFVDEMLARGGAAPAFIALLQQWCRWQGPPNHAWNRQASRAHSLQPRSRVTIAASLAGSCSFCLLAFFSVSMWLRRSPLMQYVCDYARRVTTSCDDALEICAHPIVDGGTMLGLLLYPA